MSRSLLAAVAAASVAATIATSIAVLDGTAGAAPLDPLGYVRVVHGDLGVAGRPVAVAIDGQPAGDAPWAGASPWRPVAPGRHRVTATGGTDSIVDVGAGCGVTLVTGQADLNPASRRVVIVPDCLPARLAPGQARVTAVAVTSPSFGSVDVEVRGGRLRVEPHTAAAGGVVKAGPVRVIVRDPKTDAVFLQRDAEFPEGTACTVALVGGGEAGVTLAVVKDAAQALVVPPPGQPIHTGSRFAGGRPVGVAVLLGAALFAAVAAWASRRRAVTVALVAGGLLLTGCSGRDHPVVGPPAEGSATPATPTPRPGSPVASQVPPSPPPGGPAPALASPASLRIPRLHLDLPVGRLDGIDGLPRSLPFHEVAWLTGTAGAGAAGTTALVGHTGSGPFGRLGAVRPGDEITVTDSAGLAHTFRTVSVSAHRKDAFPQEVWAPQRVPTLVLITCTGGRDPRTGLHVDNLLVRAIAA